MKKSSFENVFLLVNFLILINQMKSNEILSDFVVIKAENVSLGNLNRYGSDESTPKKIFQWLINSKNDSKIKYLKFEGDNLNSSSAKNGIILLKSEMNPFMNSIHIAYQLHLNLNISADIIWNLITDSVATYINLNPEKVRDKFVDFKGKKELSIRRDDFDLNDSNMSNKWEEVIDKFSGLVDQNTKLEVSKLFNSNFSTTSKESFVVSQLALLDSMKKYFQFKLVTACGIPEIRLIGTKNDWIQLKQKTNTLLNLIDDFSFWLNGLNKILDNFIDVFDAKIDVNFWKSIYKLSGVSGGPFISGWSTVLFAYLSDNSKNEFAWNKDWNENFAHSSSVYGGLSTRDFCTGYKKVPFKWEYYSDSIEMSLIGGLLGVQYDQFDKSLKPVFGYGVYQL